MGVNLRGCDRGVAEKFLDRPDVCSVDKELGRVSVAEGVRCDFFYYSRFAGVFTDDVFDGNGGETGRFEDVCGLRCCDVLFCGLVRVAILA